MGFVESFTSPPPSSQNTGSFLPDPGLGRCKPPPIKKISSRSVDLHHVRNPFQGHAPAGGGKDLPKWPHGYGGTFDNPLAFETTEGKPTAVIGEDGGVGPGQTVQLPE